jgi:hypothetical protein
MMKLLTLLTAMLSISTQIQAAAIPFEDYIYLEDGMSEGEVLLMVGPPDYETLINNFYLYRKIWYYIPDGNYSGDRLTKITFDANGDVINIERTNPFKRKGLRGY